MPWAPKRPCSTSGCPNLQPCALHPSRRQWAGRGTAAERGYGPEWKKLRARALERDGYRCACGVLATQVDHVMPKHRGGSDDMNNLASKCDCCARTKTGREGQAAR